MACHACGAYFGKHVWPFFDKNWVPYTGVKTARGKKERKKEREKK
jgi:hypothetical protein